MGRSLGSGRRSTREARDPVVLRVLSRLPFLPPGAHHGRRGTPSGVIHSVLQRSTGALWRGMELSELARRRRQAFDRVSDATELAASHPRAADRRSLHPRSRHGDYPAPILDVLRNRQGGHSRSVGLTRPSYFLALAYEGSTVTLGFPASLSVRAGRRFK